MIPLSTMASVKETFGPGVVTRYNLYTAADLSGDTKPGYSSGYAISVMEELCRKLLPPGFGFEWTDLTYQQILAGNTALFIFPLCVLFVFLTLAAQYESWALPFSIILIVPMCLLSSLAGVLLRRMDNNIFTQIGFVVLVGLACKNAILIVEYAKQMEEIGQGYHFRRRRSVQASPAADSDDFLRLHCRRRSAHAWVGRGRGNAADAGHRRLFGNARRDHFWYFSYARLLRDRSEVREAAKSGRGEGRLRVCQAA